MVVIRNICTKWRITKNIFEIRSDVTNMVIYYNKNAQTVLFLLIMSFLVCQRIMKHKEQTSSSKGNHAVCAAVPAGCPRSWYGLAHAACCWQALSPWRHSLGHSPWAVITSAWPTDFKVHSAHYTGLLDVTRKPCLHIQGFDWHAHWKYTISTIHTHAASPWSFN